MNQPFPARPQMPSGVALSANMNTLWSVGKIDVPNQAKVFVDANRRLHDTAFRGNIFGESVATHKSGAKWSELRDLVQRMLAETGDNLRYAGTAIVEMSHAYAYYDDAAKRSLAQHIAFVEDQPRGRPVIDLPLDYVPATRQPGQPKSIDDTPHGPGGV